MVLEKTQKKRETMEREAKVVSLYLKLIYDYPGEKSARYFNTIARELKLTPVGVRNILIRTNKYTPCSRLEE